MDTARELINIKLGEAEALLQTGKIQQCVELLNEISETDDLTSEEMGHLLFIRARIAERATDIDGAFDYYQKSYDYGYESVHLFLNLSNLCRQIGASEAQIKFLKMAAEHDWFPEDDVLVGLALQNYYLEHKMYLKSEQNAEKYQKRYPDRYEGIYMIVRTFLSTDRLTEAKTFQRKAEKQFGNHPLFLQNQLMLEELTNGEEGVTMLLDNDPSFMKDIPEITLRKKLNIAIHNEDDDKIRDTARELFLQFDSPEGEIAAVFMAINDNLFAKAAFIAGQFIQNHGPETGLMYYIILYLEHLILYRMAGGKIPEDQIPVLQKSAEVSLNGLKAYDIDVSFFRNQLNEIGLA